jgi:hypothetical protein
MMGMHGPTNLRRSIYRRGTALAFAIGIGVAAAGCESTQEKSKRLGQNGGASSEKGLEVSHRNRDVKVVSTKVLHDGNGDAAVVVLRNHSARSFTHVPVAISVAGAHGKTVFKNDQPGLEPSLTHAPLVGPRDSFVWVNDQVTPAARPRSVTAAVGDARAVSPRRVPRISLSRPRLHADPVSGTAAVGFATNRSKVEQRQVIVFAVGRKGRRIVAAGRGQIRRMKPGQRARYQIFFIGDPRGTKLALAAPPTTLG